MSKRAYTAEEREILMDRLIDRASERFKLEGIRNTNLDDIYRPLGISKTFFYTMCGSKPELMLSVAVRQTDRILSLLRERVSEAGVEDGLRECIVELIGGYGFVITVDDLQYLSSLFTEEQKDRFETVVNGFSEAFLQTVGIPEGSLDPKVFFSMIMMILWANNSRETTFSILDEDSMREATRLSVDGLVRMLMRLRGEGSAA